MKRRWKLLLILDISVLIICLATIFFTRVVIALF